MTPNHITPGAATAAPTTTEEESQNMANNDCTPDLAEQRVSLDEIKTMAEEN